MKNLTHFTGFASHSSMVETAANDASILNEQVGESEKSTVGDNAVLMLGDTNVSIKLNSAISLAQPLASTIWIAHSRVVIVLSMMMDLMPLRSCKILNNDHYKVQKFLTLSINSSDILH